MTQLQKMADDLEGAQLVVHADAVRARAGHQAVHGHHGHARMTEGAGQRLGIAGGAQQQAVDALLEQRAQVGLLVLGVVVRVAEEDRVARLPAPLLGADDQPAKNGLRTLGTSTPTILVSLRRSERATALGR